MREMAQEASAAIDAPRETDCSVNAVAFTPDGCKIAVSDGERITVRNTDDNKEVASIERKNISKFALSPDARVLVTYENFRETPDAPNGSPNLFTYDLESGKVLDSRIHIPAETWRPQWSSDSKLCLRMLQGQIHFYVDNRLDEKSCKTLTLPGMRHCSLAKSSINRNLAVYVPGKKSNPSTVCVYAWRNGECIPLANKSFFRADTVSLHWSDTGRNLLVLAATKTSDTSYYGEQMLHFITTSQAGDCASVPMPRKGPIHQVVWKPSGPRERPSDERFVVCQGSIPSVVTVFNINLNGFVTVWDFSNQTKLSEFYAQNSTYLAWLPDGEHLITAITTPRLRVNNGFTVRHYTGEIVAHEAVEKRAQPRPATMDLPAATEHELYQVLLQPVPFEKLPPAPLPRKANPNAAKVSVEKPKAYVPPALRDRSATAVHAAAVASGRPGADLRNSAHLKFTGGGPIGGITITSEGSGGGGGRKKKSKNQRGDNPPPSAPVPPSAASPLPGANPDTLKQIAYLKKKLNEIEKLKALQKTSAKLEQTQLEKLARESSLRAELAKLQL
ncbi:Eukaryotic translation initiation factor 2A [Sparganum proliferum]